MSLKDPWGLLILLAVSGSAQADIVYLNRGEAIWGTVSRIDSNSIQLTLADGSCLQFSADEVFQVIDDSGKLLYPLPASRPKEIFGAGLNPLSSQSSGNPPCPPLKKGGSEDFKTASAGYRTVYRFPFWPLLGGTALLGYVGVSQLNASSQTYQESVEREDAGLDFNALRDRSQRQRTWGQISLAGAAACLIVALTPKTEKVPISSSWRIIPNTGGLTLCMNF